MPTRLTYPLPEPLIRKGCKTVIDDDHSQYSSVSLGKLTKPFHSVYRKVASPTTPHLKAHAGFFRLLMKGIFHPYVL